MSKIVDFIGREDELELISNNIREREKKSILFLEADGGIGKTRLLQEVRDRYIDDENIIFSNIIDYDNFPFFSIDIIKNSILKELDEKEFQDYLELERDFIDRYKTKTLENQLQKMFVDSFNRLVEGKKFVLFIDTTEKIESKSFWRDFIGLLAYLNNIFVIISGRYKTISDDDLANLSNYMLVNNRRLKKFSDRESRLYFENKSKLENIKPLSKDILECLILLADGKPILIDLTVEWIIESKSEDNPEKFIINMLGVENCAVFIEHSMDELLYQKREEFEKNLVIQYENISETTQQIITLLSYISPLNLEMVKYILDEEMISKDFYRIKEYVFIKDLKTGYIVLHDEMYRLLNSYVIPRIDPNGGRKEYYSEKIIPFFEKRVQELKKELKNQEIEENVLYRLKSELNSNIVQLVKYLFCVKNLSEKAMKTLTKEFDNASYRKNFKLIKELILVSSKGRIDIKDNIDFISMKSASLSLNNKNKKAKELIESYKKEHKLSELDSAKLDNILAGINQKLGLLVEAKENQLNAFEIFKKYNQIDALPYSANHIGTIYREMGYLNRAIRYYEKALKYSKNSLDKTFDGVIFDNISEVYREQGECSNSLDSARTARELWKSAKAIKQLIRSDITFGNIYRDRGYYDKASKYYLNAQNRLNERDNLEDAINLYINMGKFYWFKYEDNKEKLFFLKDAKQYCLLAEKLSRDADNIPELIKSLSQLSNIYWDEGEKEKARETLKEFYRLAKQHSIAYFIVDAILGFVEFDYDEKVDNLSEDIQKYANELKYYEKRYNFPHFFSRIKKYQAHLLFDNKRYNEAIELYKESFIILSKHGGYSKYSLDSELENLSIRLKTINDKELLLKLIKSLYNSFKEAEANKKLISWSKNKLLQIEYGV